MKLQQKTLNKTAVLRRFYRRKMAGNGSEMKTIGKYSETAFQNCLQNFPNPRIMGDMNFQIVVPQESKI